MAIQSFETEVQACGCIALPEELSAVLRIGPGSRLAVVADPACRSLTVQASGAETNSFSATAACPIS